MIARGKPPIGSTLHSYSVFPLWVIRQGERAMAEEAATAAMRGTQAKAAKEHCAETTPTVSIADVLREG